MTRSARNERLRARAARSWTQRARLASSARSTPDSSRVAATVSRSSSGPAGGVIERGIGVLYAPPLQRRGWGWCGRCCARFSSEEHTSELQSLMRISYAVFCLKKHKEKKERNE